MTEIIAFNDNEINMLYTYIQQIFQKSSKQSYAKKLSKDEVNSIERLVCSIEDKELFKNNIMIQYSFCNLIDKKFELLQEERINYIIEGKKEQQELLNNWRKRVSELSSSLNAENNNVIKQTFGEKFKDLLDKKNLSYEEMGELLGISKSSVGAYCSGESFPKDLYRIQQICDILGCSIQYLIDKDTKMPDLIGNAVYNDTGLAIESINKLKDIRYIDEAKKIYRTLNILISNIEFDYESDLDILSALSNYLGVYPYLDTKYMVSESLLDNYSKRFDEVNSIEEAKLIFESFNKEVLESDNPNTQSFRKPKLNGLALESLVNSPNPPQKTKKSKKVKVEWPATDLDVDFSNIPDILDTDYIKGSKSPTKKFENPDTLYLCDIQQRLIALKDNLHASESDSLYVAISEEEKKKHLKAMEHIKNVLNNDMTEEEKAIIQKFVKHFEEPDAKSDL